MRSQIQRLRELIPEAQTEAEARQLIAKIANISRQYRLKNGQGVALTPALQAKEIDPEYRLRPHINLLSERVAHAVREVERGRSQRLIVSMPPRAGKSTLTSQWTPLWLLRRHPEWSVVMTSYDPQLTIKWARNMRTIIEDRPELGIALKRDAGAGGHWDTEEGGGMYATGVGGALTGRGARVLIIDDPIADFVGAHSPRIRQSLWNWWLTVAQTRLEPPYLILVTMTRWHQDDFVGRILSNEYEGDPREWTQVVLPAIADNSEDVLGRSEGEPLLSPLLEETPDEAVARWGSVKAQVGGYTWSGMYQQRPAPQKGAIFDAGWWRFWTSDPSKATPDGIIEYVNPSEDLKDARWIDSWDMAFRGGTDDSDWVVGQRWAKKGANRYLIAQRRDRWTFTQTLKEIQDWAKPNNQLLSPWGHLVHERLIENTANGPAIMNVLHDQVSGLKPVNPHASKEARARAVTPEVESGNVYLPLPSDPGNGWVNDLLSELRNFPFDAHDDQVDALTQALNEMRPGGTGGVTVPGQQKRATTRTQLPRNIAAAANTGFKRGY
jgi:predicted phage terminase large subunit-like protein